MGYVPYKMTDGKTELIDICSVSDRDLNSILDIISRYCCDDLAQILSKYIKQLRDSADYETLKFNSDFAVCEAENEDFRDTLNEIDSTLKDYEYKLERGEEKFSRKRVFKIFDDIHDLICEEI